MTPEVPPFETRARIVAHVCADEGCPITDDTAHAIAAIVDTDSIRELEGAAIRVLAVASLTDQPIGPALAAAVLADLYGARRLDRIDPDGGFGDVEFFADVAPFADFGWCPECGQSDGFLNIGREHYFYCDAHRTRWHVGSNLFSCWRDEDDVTWARNARHLEHYREVDGYTPTAAMLEDGFPT